VENIAFHCHLQTFGVIVCGFQLFVTVGACHCRCGRTWSRCQFFWCVGEHYSVVSGAKGPVQLWNSFAFFLIFCRLLSGARYETGFENSWQAFGPRVCALELGLLVKLRVKRSCPQKWAACVECARNIFVSSLWQLALFGVCWRVLLVWDRWAEGQLQLWN